MIMRSTLFALLLATALPVAAAQQSQPPGLQPLPAPPAPPPGYEPDPAPEPERSVTVRPTETIEEFRLNGKVYMVKVTPKVGKPYYLVDNIGNGKFVRYDDYDTGLRPPAWVLFNF
jgi:uncharacterized protein DUF2782